jgi:hypothetical protein
MYGHGQVEGLHEKYGMEFRKPKWNETPDEGLIRGHEWKIFPLLHRRYLFADVENFFLFDLFTADGTVDENVFAYSNCFGDERGLVIYHNKFADTRGWIKTSATYLHKSTGDLRQKSLAEALGLPFEGYVTFKDYVTHLDYIRACDELWQKGLYVDLGAYQHHVFMDWQFVEDERWQAIHDALNGAGVESMQAKWDEMFKKKETEEEVAVQAVRIKKPRKKAASKKEGGVSAPKVKRKLTSRKAVTTEETRAPEVRVKKTTRKLKTTDGQ